MKKIIVCLVFLLSTSFICSQQHSVQTFSTNAESIDIITDGLDEICIENSENSFVEVALLDKNINSHRIVVDHQETTVAIRFQPNFLREDNVFRKYITNRLNRASAVIKLPINKTVTISGTSTDIISKSYRGAMSIYLDKGFVNLNKVQDKVEIKLFQGSVFAKLHKSTIDITSNKGIITINDTVYLKKYLQKTPLTSKSFKLRSIMANVTITIL